MPSTGIKYPTCPCPRDTCAGDEAGASIGCIRCGEYTHLIEEHDEYWEIHLA